MKILSHRGYWKTAEEKNSPAAFERSFALGFGTETDLRDSLSRLVVSHDIPGSNALPAEALFDSYAHARADADQVADLPLALNIKSDGLQKLLRATLDAYRISNYFLFDMSIPDALNCIRHDLKVFTRQSEWEREPSFYKEAAGVWMDGFFSDWMDESAISEHLDRGKSVCLVSPELHQRDRLPFWEKLAAMSLSASPNLMLCTDLPEDARRLFNA